MGTLDGVKEWLKLMQYPGKIPERLSLLVNPVTSPIWFQIIEQVEPKDKIKEIHQNVIASRLSEYEIDQNGRVVFEEDNILERSKLPIKHIEIWKERYRLENEVEELHGMISKNEQCMQDLQRENKLEYVRLENKKQKRNEIKEKTFIMMRKQDNLEQEFEDVSDMLSLIEISTPVVGNETENNKEKVLETLKKCAEKLQKIISKQQKHNTGNISMASTLQLSQIPQNATYFGLDSTPSASLMKQPRNVLENSFTRSFLDITNFEMRSTKKMLLSAKKSTTKKMTSQKFDLSTIDGLDDSLGLLDDSSLAQNDLLFESAKIMRKKSVEGDLATLLRSYSRSLIFNMFLDVTRDVKSILEMVATNEKYNKSFTAEIPAEELNKIYAKHIENEVDNLGLELTRKRLEKQVVAFKKSMKSWEIAQELKLLGEEAGLYQAKVYLEEELKYWKRFVGFSAEIENVTRKLKRQEQVIYKKSSKIRDKLETLDKLHDQILSSKEDNYKHLIKRSHLVEDLDWTQSLLENQVSSEFEVFLEFPLEFNRRIPNEDVFNRDTINHSLTSLEHYDQNLKNTYLGLILAPSFTPEFELMNLVELKKEIKDLQAIPLIEFPEHYHKYCPKDLSQKYKHIEDNVSKKFENFRYQLDGHITTLIPQIRNTLDFWKEMPLKKYISSSRLVGGKPYAYYDKICYDLVKNKL